MKELQGLRDLFIIAALLAVTLLIIAGLVSADAVEALVPSPEITTNEFIGALSAHRYYAAVNLLSEPLKQQVDKAHLQSIMQAIEQSALEGIQDAQGQESQIEGETASVDVEVEFGNNQTQTIALPLKKENGLWKVSNLEPLQALALPTP